VTDDETHIIESYACRGKQFSLPAVWPFGDVVTTVAMLTERRQWEAQVAHLAARIVTAEQMWQAQVADLAAKLGVRE